MFKRLFGGTIGLDRPTLAKWLAGKNPEQVRRWNQGFTAALLEQLDSSQIVESNTTETDRNGPGGELIKGRVIQLLCGGPLRLGFPDKQLTQGQADAAQRIYQSIADSGHGELFAAAGAAATFHAMSAWYTENYADAASIATHIVTNLDPANGEAYRIRAFARIMMQDLESARDDLQTGIRVMPSISGAKRPLEAVDRQLNSR